MTELTHGKSDLANASSAAWADRREAQKAQLPAGFFFVAMRGAGVKRSRWVRRLFQYWLRRSLRTLSDRQLRDAGIDPTRAGRSGRAADVRADPNIGSGY